MALSPGTRLGGYQIVGAIGAGGMGEVYRARDTKLGREVAIKVLPEAWAFDADRAARFEREAQVLASLNHPHIAALYGMEQSDGRHFLVMELVEGETLAERLARAEGLRPRRAPAALAGVGSPREVKTSSASGGGAPRAVNDVGLPLAEALEFAHQIAEALEAAHEKGIVHRDLKPANVKITPDEQVKVLDFGLAKAMDPVAGIGDGSPYARQGDPSPFSSPTLSLMATQAGVILGTAAYMSPEQAQGLAADPRSDVFSFGSVLYEMLTGRQPFQGDTAAALLASVLVREPDLGALPPNLNPRLPELLKRCLEKNPKRRWQAVGDLRAEIETVAAAPHSAPTTTIVAAPPQPLWRRLALVGAPALIVGAAIAGGTVWLATRPVPVPPHVTRFTITSSGAAALTINGVDRDLALTPDGTHIVYVGNNGTQLFARSLDALDPVAIASGALRGPFVSSDGQWVGFVDSGNTLKKVAITGAPPITLARIDGSGPRGATWAPDGTIIFATSNPATGLQRVSAAGGTPDIPDRPEAGRARGKPSPVAGTPARRPRGPLHDRGTDGRARCRADCRPRSSHQDAKDSPAWRERRTLRGERAWLAEARRARRRPPGVHRGGDDPRHSVRSQSPGDRGTAVPVVRAARRRAPGRASSPSPPTGRWCAWMRQLPGHSAHAGVGRSDGQGSRSPHRRGATRLSTPRPTGRVAVAAIDQEAGLRIWDLRQATSHTTTLEPGEGSMPQCGRRMAAADHLYLGPRGRVFANLWWQAARCGRRHG